MKGQLYYYFIGFNLQSKVICCEVKFSDVNKHQTALVVSCCSVISDTQDSYALKAKIFI